MTLIHAPFIVTYYGRSYPWGGVAVADTFYGSYDWAERPRPTNDVGSTHWRTVSMQTGGGSIADVMKRNW